MSRWISVKDRLPPDRVTILCYFKGGTFSLGYYHADHELPWGHACDNPYATPTHWQPLPNPPEDP